MMYAKALGLREGIGKARLDVAFEHLEWDIVQACFFALCIYTTRLYSFSA